jgi:predicted RNA binding protein YcfA (HicA-like mRNA interferase family)
MSIERVVVSFHSEETVRFWRSEVRLWSHLGPVEAEVLVAALSIRDREGSHRRGSSRRYEHQVSRREEMRQIIQWIIGSAGRVRCAYMEALLASIQSSDLAL